MIHVYPYSNSATAPRSSSHRPPLQASSPSSFQLCCPANASTGYLLLLGSRLSWKGRVSYCTPSCHNNYNDIGNNYAIHIPQCGVETLLHDEVGYHEALQLYKQLFLHSLKLVSVSRYVPLILANSLLPWWLYYMQREEFFLEMVFFLVSHGNVEEAFEMFQE